MGCRADDITNNAYDVTGKSRALEAVLLLDVVDNQQEGTADHNQEFAQVVMLLGHARTSGGSGKNGAMTSASVSMAYSFWTS